MTSIWKPKPFQNGIKIDEKTISNKTYFFRAFFFNFSPFSNSKSIDFGMHFQAICQASAKNTKPQKLSSRLGENTIFEVSSFKKTTKIQHKKLQNEGTKKTSKKSLQKSISGAILGSKILPNPSKIDPRSSQEASRSTCGDHSKYKHEKIHRPLGVRCVRV